MKMLQFTVVPFSVVFDVVENCWILQGSYVCHSGLGLYPSQSWHSTTSVLLATGLAAQVNLCP